MVLNQKKNRDLGPYVFNSAVKTILCLMHVEIYDLLFLVWYIFLLTFLVLYIFLFFPLLALVPASLFGIAYFKKRKIAEKDSHAILFIKITLSIGNN